MVNTTSLCAQGDREEATYKCMYELVEGCFYFIYLFFLLLLLLQQQQHKVCRAEATGRLSQALTEKMKQKIIKSL